MVDGILFSLFLVPENWVLARSRIYKDMLKLQGDPPFQAPATAGRAGGLDPQTPRLVSYQTIAVLI